MSTNDNTRNRNFDPNTIPGEYNVVALWTKFRGARLRAGVMAGIFAGFMMQLFGVVYYAFKGDDLVKPFKIAALPILGNSALAYGSVQGVVVGLIVFYALMSFLGMAYAHFTGTNHLGNRFGIGITWAAFGWVFITNLFCPAFRSYSEADIPRGAMFFAWIVFGLSLMSVKWFDKNGPAR
jgi:hypothetical protein